MKTAAQLNNNIVRPTLPDCACACKQAIVIVASIVDCDYNYTECKAIDHFDIVYDYDLNCL